MTARVGALIRWADSFNEEKRSALLVLDDRPAVRARFYEKYLARKESHQKGSYESWQTIPQNVLGHVANRIAGVHLSKKGLPIWFPPEKNVWELIWALVAAEDIVIQEPLRTLVDDAGFLAHHFYKLLWEARFLAKENVNLKGTQSLVLLITRWLLDEKLPDKDVQELHSYGVRLQVQSDSQRFDLLCMLVTLAEHNGLLKRMLFGFDGLENVLDQQPVLRGLNRFVDAIDRWIKVGGSPIGVLIGFDATPANMAKLRDHHPRLADHVQRGRVWNQE